MGDVFVVKMGGDDEDARAAGRAERQRLRGRYARHLVSAGGIDERTAARVMAALFDHVDAEGGECPCGCHPRLDSLHDDGFDCPCTWDEPRRGEERRSWEAFRGTPEGKALREHHAAQERDIEAWLAGQPGVEAARTTSYAPEQWQGMVDGHSFYFRERHGEWRVELDLEPTGELADRLLEIREDGEIVTELVPIERGQVIAEGIDSQLGSDPVEHIDFIVRTIRDHIWGRSCDHAGALFFCPSCGQRMSGPR
jgi:hypothetical protein